MSFKRQPCLQLHKSCLYAGVHDEPGLNGIIFLEQGGLLPNIGVAIDDFSKGKPQVHQSKDDVLQLLKIVVHD